LVLDRDKGNITIERGDSTNGGTSFSVNIASVNANELPLIVTRFGHATFPSQYTFYVKTISGDLTAEIEVKNHDGTGTSPKWYNLVSPSDSKWHKITLDIDAMEYKQPHKIDKQDIFEILVHFKYPGKYLFNGIAKPDFIPLF
jgi:hypothetical protein